MDEFETKNVQQDQQSDQAVNQPTEIAAQKKKPSKGAMVLFAVACVFFAVAMIVNAWLLSVWGAFLPTLLSGGTGDAGEALGAIIGMIFFLVPGFIVVGIISVIAIVLMAFCVRNYKIAAIIMLVLLSLIFIANFICFILLTNNHSSSDTESAALMVNYALSLVG